jgi:nitrite reductase (NO-forming)
MNLPKRISSPRVFGNPFCAGVAIAAGIGLHLSADACDACNLSFADQVMNERANSSIGRDLRRAMENQKDLNLEGFSDPALMAAQRTMLVAAGGSGAEARTAGIPSNGARTVSAASPSASLPEARAAEAQNSRQLFPVSQGRELPSYMNKAGFLDIIERDYKLPTTPYSTVPQDAPVDKSFTIRMSEGSVYIGNGVIYEGFHMDGKIPGPTIIVDEGDVVEMSFVNEGTIPHGASIHAAYTQTSKYVGKIGVGETKSVRFRAMMPGVYMYHCAPGGHAIGMHVIGGQYGMIVVKPKPGTYQLEKELGHPPNIELYLIQHELYASGKDSISGDPEYVLFNGRTFRYVEEPIMAHPGDYVRINFLNPGPNILSTFHIVGIIWDYVYWQGNPTAMMSGGQTVTAGPADSFVIEFRMPPDEGAYTMLTHAVGSTSRGAIGLIVVDDEAKLQPHRTILADGPAFNEAEMRGYKSDATRIISPFGIGTHPKDEPVVYGPETKEVKVSIIGNSFSPKVIKVAPGTTVTWTNEDVFTYMAGEYAGIHNVAGMSAPDDSDGLNSPLLAHGESFSQTFTQEWTYDYVCTPHPYMKGRVIVATPEYQLGAGGGSGSGALGPWVLPLIGLCLLMSTATLVVRRRRG